MEGTSSGVFAAVVTEEEWAAIPVETANKLEKFVNEKFEELITSKALHETARYEAERSLADLKTQLETVSRENETLKLKLDAANATVEELESQISTLTGDVGRLQANCNRLEAEAADFRHQRNLAVDERDEHLKMLQRRNTEIERLQNDLTTITRQFEAAVNAKCEAMADADEVASTKLRLEYREKRMEQERQLLTSQIESLTDDLNQRTEELLNMRRDNTSRCIQLETKLTEKTQELVVANEQIKSLTDMNNNYATRNEELAQKLLNQREQDAKMNESYLHEVEAKTKLANAYKAMVEEGQQHAEGLKEALAEVQQLLKHATEQYGDLETKHKEAELAHEEIIAKKNECIALLKKELEVSKDLIENCKQEQLHKDIEGLSPTAASASRLFKSGMTVTEIYSQYVALSEKLTDQEKENAQLTNYVTSIIREIEEKGPLIQKLRDDYANAQEANEILQNAHDSMLEEVRQLRQANAESVRQEEAALRENARYRKEVADLSRQVCHLLQEVEHSRVGSSSTSTDNDLSDSVSSADVISKKLVTFNDIAELQKNNQKLLCVVRELTERQEEVESFDPAIIANMKMKLEELQDSHREILEERERQNKMMITLGSQRDMYKNLYVQAVRASGEEVPNNLDNTFNNTSEHNNTSSSANNSKGMNDSAAAVAEVAAQQSQVINNRIKELQSQIDTYKEKVDALKAENEVYRKEKSANEKILLEQMEKMRVEMKDLVRLNCKLSSQLENSEEKFKVCQNNMEIYKKQIGALEKQNKIYSETIVKHEQTITYLKEETMQCQTKLSRAEVMLGNVQKENALLRDAESRLVKERDNLRRDSLTQNMIQSNMELIKATLERTDAEGKMRLESRLDEAHRECAALRRRLQEEQDRFRQLQEHLENQTQNAKLRMEEEKSEADRMRQELAVARDELVLKASQIEDLTKKVKTSVVVLPESSADLRKIGELEQQVSDSKAEIEALQAKLKTAKEASEQYFNVATNSENQLKIVLEQQAELKQELEKNKQLVKQLQEKCSELEGELSIQMDDQDMASVNIQTRSTQLQEELNVATMDLQTAREQLENARAENKSLIENLRAVENKYAREVMLHSSDLQLLTDLKTELEKTLGELNEIQQARDCALQELEERKQSWQAQEQMLLNEKAEIERRLQDLDQQNSLLLDQIQGINTQMSLLQAQVSSSSDQNTSVGADSSLLNRSFAEDEVKSSSQLLNIIKYLRQEKDIAVSKAEIAEAEYERLKSQYENTCQQLAEAKAAIEAERQKSEISVVTASKHSEVLRRVETLNAITDSNRALRQERDTLKAQIEEMRAQIERFEADLNPIQEKNRELSIKAEAMQTENISLRGECTRWRQRAQMLIEKSNRTSPEDWKKLQGERETLAKQLTIERGNVAKLTDEVNTLRQDKSRLEEQLKNLRAQNNSQAEELSRVKDELANLQVQITQLSQSLEQVQETNKRVIEENRVLTEDTAGKDVNITELKNNLAQIRKIAKKYKIQCEDQIKEISTLKAESELKETEQNQTNERQMQEQRDELEERISQLEQANKEAIEKLNRDIAQLNEQNENYKKEIETMKQGALDKEERFKALFKNAKDRIVILTEQNNALKTQLDTQAEEAAAAGEGSSTSAAAAPVNERSEEDDVNRTELLGKIDSLEKEKASILADKRQENEKYASEIETLMQKVTQLQRQLGQQGSKPSTSSGSSEKSSTEPPTANIKPMAGHSTNTQTQSVPIHPWRSAGETPLASIRPMSAQLRTVTVLPTSQSPSAVMVPPQQQVHTTGSSTIESLSSSPTSSHTDYVPATSSASSAMLGGGPRQVAVPPTQSSQDAEDDDNSMQVQTAPQQQAVALVLPRVEPPSSGGGTTTTTTTSTSGNAAAATAAPASTSSSSSASSSGPTQEQGTSSSSTSSSSSNTVTTTHQTGGVKRPREADADQAEEQSGSGGGGGGSSGSGTKTTQQPQSKRTRVVLQPQHHGQASAAAAAASAVPTTAQAQQAQTQQMQMQQAVVQSGAAVASTASSGTTTSSTAVAAVSGSSDSSSGHLEVEYQVPTSSQRDHDDDNVIVVESDDEGGADEGEGVGAGEEDEDDQVEPDDADGDDVGEVYDMEEGMEQDTYEDADCQEDVEDEEEEGGNEVEVIEDSNEVPNQSANAQEGMSQEQNEQAQPEATSSGTDGGGASNGGGVVTLSQASTSSSSSSHLHHHHHSSRARPVPPLPSPVVARQQPPQHLNSPQLLHHHHHLHHGSSMLMEEGGDDGIVPSTPTLYVPRRSDGFGEAISSPHVPTSGSSNSGGGGGGGSGGGGGNGVGARFTFNDAAALVGQAQGGGGGDGLVLPEQTLEASAVHMLDDNSTGRSVPSTPLQSSPQEPIPGMEDQGSSQTTQSDAEIPQITVSGADEDEPPAEGSSEECMGPPGGGVAGTSGEGASDNQAEESEGYDGVTSEGEKPPSTEDGAGAAEEEGREAEASPSTNTRSRTTTPTNSSQGGSSSPGGSGSSNNRRSIRPNSRGGGGGMSRSGPTPIVWGGEQHRGGGGQRHQQDGGRGRPGGGMQYSRVARRGARGRSSRPYGRF